MCCRFWIGRSRGRSACATFHFSRPSWGHPVAQVEADGCDASWSKAYRRGDIPSYPCATWSKHEPMDPNSHVWRRSCRLGTRSDVTSPSSSRPAAVGTERENTRTHRCERELIWAETGNAMWTFVMNQLLYRPLTVASPAIISFYSGFLVPTIYIFSAARVYRENACDNYFIIARLESLIDENPFLKCHNWAGIVWWIFHLATPTRRSRMFQFA